MGNEYGWTALMLAQHNSQKDCVVILHGVGALRRCMSCCTTDTLKWRRSLCNKCYLKSRRANELYTDGELLCIPAAQQGRHARKVRSASLERRPKVSSVKAEV